MSAAALPVPVQTSLPALSLPSLPPSAPAPQGLTAMQIMVIGAAVLVVAGSAYAVYLAAKKPRAGGAAVGAAAGAAASPTLLARPRGAVIDLPPDAPVFAAPTGPLTALLAWKPDPKKFGGVSISTKVPWF